MNDNEKTASTNAEFNTPKPPPLPFALQKRVTQQYIGAAMVAALTIACLIFLQSIGYVVGFVFAGYLVWMGWDIVNRWRSGNIACRRVVCLKAQRMPLMKNKQVVVLKKIGMDSGEEATVRTYFVPASGRDAAQFSERMILDVYVEAKNASELIAWQAIDLAQ